MQGLRDDLIEFYGLEHLRNQKEELYTLEVITNQITRARDYRDYLERYMRYNGITEDDVSILDSEYTRLDGLNHLLLEEIERLRKL